MKHIKMSYSHLRYDRLTSFPIVLYFLFPWADSFAKLDYLYLVSQGEWDKVRRWWDLVAKIEICAEIALYIGNIPSLESFLSSLLNDPMSYFYDLVQWFL